jgi:hypothetical protein
MLSPLNDKVSNLHPQGVTHTSREWKRSTSRAESTHQQGMARTYLERERSTSHVESSHSQGVARRSLDREGTKPHVESSHPQGVVKTSLEREGISPHVESQAPLATGSSDALVLVSTERLAASRGRTYALPAEAAQARERSGVARETPAHTAGGPGLREQRRRPGGGGSHPAQPASVQAHVGSSLVSEAAFDAALASKDSATAQRAFDRFYTFRQCMEMEQETAIRVNVAQTFKRLGLRAPATNLAVDEYGFDASIIEPYSAFLRQKHDLLGDLIRLHRREDFFDRQPNKHLFVPVAEFPSKGRWTHIVANGVIPTFHAPLLPQETPPANHKSWSKAFPLLIRDVAKGQRVGEYLI